MTQHTDPLGHGRLVRPARMSPLSAAASRSPGDRLRARRSANGWTQSTLARLPGVSQPTVNRWDSGTIVPLPADLDARLEVDSGTLSAWGLGARRAMSAILRGHGVALAPTAVLRS